MLINTRDFGEIEADEKQIISFVKPMLGFDEYTKYIVLFDEQLGDSFAWLQSVEDSEVCFMLANPKLLEREYSPEISDENLNQIDGKFDEIWLVAVIAEDIEKSKVNLKSPVLINTETQTALQAVSESRLPVRYELFSGKEI